MADSPSPHAGGATSAPNLDETLFRPEADSQANTPPEGSYAEGVMGYELLAELGRGGMGVVYKARQRGLNRLVGPQDGARRHARRAGGAGARFRAEAEAVARIQHPHVVQIYEIGEQGGPALPRAGARRGHHARRKSSAARPAAEPAGRPPDRDPARAVHFAHTCGVVHRDLKPGNMLLAAPRDGRPPTDADGLKAAALYGVPKVTDFGLAKRLDEDGSDQTAQRRHPRHAVVHGPGAGRAADA